MGQAHPSVEGVFHGAEQGLKREEDGPGLGLRGQLGLTQLFCVPVKLSWD